MSPSCYGAKAEGQRTWGIAKQSKNQSRGVSGETCQLRHSCWEEQGRAAAKWAVHEGRLRALEMAEEGVTATFFMFVIPPFETELVHFQCFV